MRIIPFLIALLTLTPLLVADDTSDRVEKERAQRLEAWRASKEGLAALKQITSPDSRLQVRLVLDKDAPGEFDEIADPSSNEKLHVSKEVLLNEKAFASASLAAGEKAEQNRVRATLTDAGANQMEWVTSRNINHRLAIVFDKKLFMAPTIRSTIRQSLEITGGANGLAKEEGERLVAAIRGDK
jgi:preprotein translocase subunit SecD